MVHCTLLVVCQGWCKNKLSFLNVCSQHRAPSTNHFITFHLNLQLDITHSSTFNIVVHVTPEHPVDGKGKGNEEEDGAGGAGLVVDDEVGGVEEEEQQVSGQHEQE